MRCSGAKQALVRRGDVRDELQVCVCPADGKEFLKNPLRLHLNVLLSGHAAVRVATIDVI